MKSKLLRILKEIKDSGKELSFVIDHATAADGIESVQKKDLRDSLRYIAIALALIEQVEKETFKNE